MRHGVAQTETTHIEGLVRALIFGLFGAVLSGVSLSARHMSVFFDDDDVDSLLGPSPNNAL